MKTTLSIALALVAPALAIPPEDFGFPSAPNDTVLSAAFGQSTDTYQNLQPGALFGVGIPASSPLLGLQTLEYESLANYTGSYVVCMVDPDASYPQAPSSRFILHWLQANMSLSNGTLDASEAGLAPGSIQLLNKTAALISYRRPSPPSNSSAHRYLLYAFQQPNNFSIPAAYSGYSDSNRTHFNLTNFIRDTNLGTPAAANYMYVSNQTGVPSDFVAAAGSSYPSGNGQAITSGDAGASYLATAMTSATATSSASGSGSGSSSSHASSASATGGSASSSSSAGAAMITGMGGLVGAGLVGLAAFL